MDGKWLMMKIHFFHVANQFAPLVVSMASVQPLMFVPVRLDGKFLIERLPLSMALFSLQFYFCLLLLLRYGTNCTECVTLPGCVHGKCEGEALTCECDVGFEGGFCDRRMSFLLLTIIIDVLVLY